MLSEFTCSSQDVGARVGAYEGRSVGIVVGEVVGSDVTGALEGF